MPPVIRCSFREAVRQDAGTEVATCRLLQQLTALKSDELCAVRRDACAACCESFRPSCLEINPVVASLLYALVDHVIERGGSPGCGLNEAVALRKWAEDNLAVADNDEHIAWAPKRFAEPLRRRTPSCDVIVCCADSSPRTRRAVRSILAQQQAAPVVHLVDDGGGGGPVLQRYRDRWNVVTHTNAVRLGPFESLHRLVPHLRTEFVAIQDSRTTSRPERLRYCVGMLAEHGGDLLAGALETPGGTVFPEPPGHAYQRSLAPQTLVFRRAALVDMGGIADRAEDADAELVYRAAREKRRIILARRVTVDSATSWSPGPVGPPPAYTAREGTLRHHARGFPEQTVPCDVVLPFHGHLNYVREAMESLIEQDGAEPVIHLVDDASAENTDQVLSYWGTHRRVRTYRNVRNLGQFVSFNNLLPYLETGLVAVQDADDISLPGRLHRAGNLLRLADADIFAGSTRLFGQRWLRSATVPGQGQEAARQARGHYRLSLYPVRRRSHFLWNATAVLRVSAFAMLGGFGDFGDVYRNRCGLDTEFYLRAYYGGVRFAITRDVVLDYRCHGDSATQNSLTGWGTAARSWSENECRRRWALFQQGPFDPRAFGGLRNYTGLTRRVQAS